MGRVVEDVHPLLDELLLLRAQRQLRDRFGGVDQARDVVNAMAALLNDLDEPFVDKTDTEEPQPKRRGSRRAKGGDSEGS